MSLGKIKLNSKIKICAPTPHGVCLKYLNCVPVPLECFFSVLTLGKRGSNVPVTSQVTSQESAASDSIVRTRVTHLPLDLDHFWTYSHTILVPSNEIFRLLPKKGSVLEFWRRPLQNGSPAARTSRPRKKVQEKRFLGLSWVITTVCIDGFQVAEGLSAAIWLIDKAAPEIPIRVVDLSSRFLPSLFSSFIPSWSLPLFR